MLNRSREAALVASAIVRPMKGLDELTAAAGGGASAAKRDLPLAVMRLLDAGQDGRVEIERFLRGATPREWATFDASMRAFWHSDRLPPNTWWLRILQGVGVGQPDDIVTIGLASMDLDGHVREEAVRRLPLLSDPLLGCFLALRTVDWVEAVATLAGGSLAARIKDDQALLVAAAPIVFHLADRRRTSHLDDHVLERAASDPGALAALLALSDTRTRRRLIAAPAVRMALSDEQLLRLARSDDDIVVAARAGIELVSRTSAGDASTELLDGLMTGPAPVRRAVLEVLATRADGLPIAKRHLFDPSPGVRAAAQVALQLGGQDPALVYRAALEQSDRVPTAIAELATLGNIADRARVLAALRSDDVATRRAAANAVRLVAPERLRELLVPLLSDSSPGVTRIAFRRLVAKAKELDATTLSELAAAPRSHNRRAAYRLMRRRSAAERVEADLMAAMDADARTRQTAIADLQSWLYLGAASSPRADLATRRRMAARLDAVASALRPGKVDRIRFHAGLRAQDLA